jgi:hypothetical protein
LSNSDRYRCEVVNTGGLSGSDTINMYLNGTIVSTFTNSTSLPATSIGPAFEYTLSNVTGSPQTIDNFWAGDLPTFAILTSEQIWSQPQHFSTVTVGTADPTGAPLTPGTVYTATLQTTSANGGDSAAEGTGAITTPGLAIDTLWADNTFHRFAMNNNNGGKEAVVGMAAQGTANNSACIGASGWSVVDCGVSGPIADIQFTVGNATAVGATTCLSTVTIAMTGVAVTTSFTDPTPTASTATVTGWGAPTQGLLYIIQWPTVGNYNYQVCNPTASGITTSAAVTFNVGAR